MRAVVLIVPLILTACATPRETCISNVEGEIRVVNQLIAVTRANLDRGFAIEQEQEIRTRRSFCRGRDHDGNRFRGRCNDIRTITRDVPVTINLEEEREKLAQLEQRQAQNLANAQAGIAQCNARFADS